MTKQHEELAFMSGAFAVASFLILVYNVYKTKNTSYLTFVWLFLVIVAQVLMVIYGKLNHFQGLYIPAIIYIIAELIGGLLAVVWWNYAGGSALPP